MVLQTAWSSRGVSSRHPLERFHSVCSKFGGIDWTISSKQTYLGSFQELGTAQTPSAPVDSFEFLRNGKKSKNPGMSTRRTRRAGVANGGLTYEEMNPGSPTIRVTSPRSGVAYSAVDTNLNTNWLENKASWLFYTMLVVAGWLIVSNFVDPGMAWCVVSSCFLRSPPLASARATHPFSRRPDARRTVVHICHGLVTYYLFHWIKGSPIDGDQGKYDSLTFWEQIDSEVQGTSTRKFFMLVPVVLFFLASHGSAYDRQPLGINLGVLIVLLVAKLSSMHRVRIFGINKY